MSFKLNFFFPHKQSVFGPSETVVHTVNAVSAAGADGSRQPSWQ